MASDGALDRTIAAQVEEWSSSSTEALELSIYRGDEEIDTFSPEFTYPIFGEEEVIFGYQGLSISLAFAAHDLRPHLEITYDRKWPDQGEVKATDILDALNDFLPEAAFNKVPRENALADPKASDFVPPGQRLHTYHKDDQTFEVWCSSMEDPRARRILENIQVLVPLFIEGGTIVELEHPWIVKRWKVFLLYEVDESNAPNVSRYSIAGYSTSFRTFTFPDKNVGTFEETSGPKSEEDFDAIVSRWAKSNNKPTKDVDPLELPSRERLSQFIILPKYQKHGLGTQVYNTMYAELTTPTNVVEFTVEDPNEAFDDMRDVCDMIHLRAHNPDFHDLRIQSSVPASDLKSGSDVPIDVIVDGATKERIRKSSKIMPRQLARLIEMQTLSKIPSGNRKVQRISRKEHSTNEQDRAYYFWRLYVKQRLRDHNRDALLQLDRDEQIEKLEGAIEGLQMSYEKILGLVDKRMTLLANGNGHGKKRQRLGRKRKLADDGGEAQEVDEDDGVSSKPRKRRAARVVDEDDDGEESEDIGDALNR